MYACKCFKLSLRLRDENNKKKILALNLKRFRIFLYDHSFFVFPEFLIRTASVETGYELIEWLIDTVDLTSSADFKSKLSSLLLNACRLNDYSVVRTVFMILKKCDNLQSELEKIDQDGNTVLTISCDNPNPNIEIVETILREGLPDELLLHQFAGKNAYEWAKLHSNQALKSLLVAEVSRQKLFLMPSEQRQRLSKYISQNFNLSVSGVLWHFEGYFFDELFRFSVFELFSKIFEREEKRQ